MLFRSPGVPAVPKPAVPQLRIVILSGPSGSPSQDRFKLPATLAVTVAGHLKRSGNLNRPADSDSEPAAAADSELKYFHRGLHRLRGPGPGYRVVILSGASEDWPGALPGPPSESRTAPASRALAGSALERPPASPEPLAGDFKLSPSPIRRRGLGVKHAGPSQGK